MKQEYPIIFSGEMVKAILAGRKTMTRRIVKPQPLASVMWSEQEEAWYAEEPEHYNGHDKQFRLMKCPYGKPGDRLWVKEAWRTHRCYDDASPRDVPEDASLWWLADTSSRRGLSAKPGRYRHARFMPRWASRITLEITSIKMERLQDISEKDAVAEGTHAIGVGAIRRPAAWSERQDFANLWDAINGAGSWDLNPWVWVIFFNEHRERAIVKYRKHSIYSQFRPKSGDYVAKVVAPDGTEYGPFLGTNKESAENLARAKIRELCPWRDLDEEPLTSEEAAERTSDSTPFHPKKRRGLSRFLEEEE